MIGGKSVSVLVPSLPKDSLIELLRSLQGQPYDELLVDVDSGTVAKKRQRLFNRSKGDIVVYLDDDVYVPKNFLQDGVTRFLNSNARYGQFKVVGGINNSEDVFVGAATIFDRSVLAYEANWNDAMPFYNEDIDLHWQLQSLQIPYIYIDNVTAYHPNTGNYEKLVEGNRLLQQKYPKKYKELKQELR